MLAEIAEREPAGRVPPTGRGSWPTAGPGRRARPTRSGRRGGRRSRRSCRRRACLRPCGGPSGRGRAPASAGQDSACERSLGVGRGGDRPWRGRKHHEERIALGRDLDTAGRLRTRHEATPGGARGRGQTGSQPRRKAGRALDVREQEGDCSRGQVRPHGRRDVRRRRLSPAGRRGCCRTGPGTRRREPVRAARCGSPS